MSNDRFAKAIEQIDAANREDPSSETAGGRDYPKEYLYSLRMTEQLERFAPAAGEALRIAARAQHIRRWRIPRGDYPPGRNGYLSWRRDLGRFHAEQTAAIMAAAGYEEDSIARVKQLLTKQGIKRDPDTQTLEDVICLVFIKYYLEPFASQHDEAKLVDIIRKTWKKMSGRGQAAALELPLNEEIQALIQKALQA